MFWGRPLPRRARQPAPARAASISRARMEHGACGGKRRSWMERSLDALLECPPCQMRPPGHLQGSEENRASRLAVWAAKVRWREDNSVSFIAGREVRRYPIRIPFEVGPSRGL